MIYLFLPTVFITLTLLTLHKFDAIDVTESVSFARFRSAGRSGSEVSHILVFAVQQLNANSLEHSLVERSTPGSALYQQWLSFEEVGMLSSNPLAAATILDWLSENNVTVVWKSARLDYIKAEAEIARWEKLLGATFFRFEEKNTEKRTRQIVHRTAEYSLPLHIQPHVHTVLNTVQEPFSIVRASPQQPSPALFGAPSQNIVDIALLEKFYGTDTCTDPRAGLLSSRLQQAVVETADQRFSFEDIALFQQLHHLPLRAPLDPYGYNTTRCRGTTTANNVDYPCNEGNLNLQYIMGVAPCVETLFLYVAGDDPFVDWITSFADLADPPKVFTVPWYSVEQFRSIDIIDVFNREALKLSLMGVTIVVAAGSSGAANDASYCDATSGPPEAQGQGYFPSFPATSPYVTAVGATMGPETNTEEIACQSQLGGVITTGGGFSTYNPTPSWQVDTVSAYFSRLTTDQTATAGYNRHGRAYPDVSLLGTSYSTIVNNEVVIQHGTEAASAVFAAMVSLINLERVRNNQTSVGFINPTLYKYGAGKSNWYNSMYHSVKRVMSKYTLFGYFHDITSGNNKCMALVHGSSSTTLTCCDSGFYASEGWDPVTGWGSVQYSALREMFVTDATSGSTNALSSGAIAAIVIGAVVFVLFVWLAVVGVQIRYEEYVANHPRLQVNDDVVSNAALSSNGDNLPDQLL